MFGFLAVAAAQADNKAASDVSNAGALCYQHGDYAQAEALLTRSVALWTAEGESSGEGYAATLNNLAAVYRTQGRYKEAEKLYREALRIREHNGTAGTEENANVLHNLGRLYLATAQYDSAEAFARRALQNREELVGKSGNAVAESTNLLGVILQRTNRLPEALNLYRQALHIADAAPDKRETTVAEIFTNLGALYRTSGDLPMAEQSLTRAIKLLRDEPASTPLLPTALNNLGLVARAEGDDTRAQSLFEDALSVWEKMAGRDQLEYASILSNLALIYLDRHKPEKAHALYLEAFQIHASKLGANNPLAQNDLINLGEVSDARRAAKGVLPSIRSSN